MSNLGVRAEAVRETIAELCESPPEPEELVDEVASRVRRVVPYDQGAWMIADPETLLPTSGTKINTTGEIGVAHSRDELMATRPDFNDFADLVRTGVTATSLALATGGELERSRRYRAIHVPHGLADELRCIARSAGSTWAYGCVTRASDVPDFTEDEVRYVATIADLLGSGLRRALSRRDPAAADSLRTPGMLVVGPDLRVEATTGEADRWLERLPRGYAGDLPMPIAAVAMQAQANALAAEPARAARLRLRVAGGWLLIHADALKDAGVSAGRVAVMLELADRAALIPLLLALHGLTGREREVAELLVGGLSTDEIAARMHISRHTLRDHVKAIFAKVGVSSRPELTAALAQEPLAA